MQAGIHYSDVERAPCVRLLTEALTSAELDAVRTAIDDAVDARLDGDDPTIRRDDEHLLQSVIRQHPAVAGIEQQAMREVPAWRPTDTEGGWTRGFIDLVGLDGNGDIAIAETKIEKNADPLFVLQGLDYLVWATAYREALVARLGAADSARLRLNLVVGAHSADGPRLPEYTRTLAAALDDTVTCSGWVVRDWAKPGARPTGERRDLDA